MLQKTEYKTSVFHKFKNKRGEWKDDTIPNVKKMEKISIKFIKSEFKFQ